MNTEKLLQSLTLEEKIAQMFILGFQGEELNENNEIIQELVKKGLGGVIFFSENIKSYEQTKNLINDFRKLSKIPLFTSIDQEGGFVERTINIKNKINYITPKGLANSKNLKLIEKHSEILVNELNYLGFNMNFAPVLDVNTCISNPIIGVRAFSNDYSDIIKFSESVISKHVEKQIIPVAKHFPGHGDTRLDSHLEMPVVKISFEEMEKKHISPFKSAINKGLDAIMVSHIHYECFNSEKKPASLSKEVVGYIRKKLDFDGLTISDDMVMGGISNDYSPAESCITAINAGLDMFIFRNSSKEELMLIKEVVNAVKSNLIKEEKITQAVRRILKLKAKYKLFQNTNQIKKLDISNYNKIIDQIALESIKLTNNNFTKHNIQNILILSPDLSDNKKFSNNKFLVSDFITGFQCREIKYNLFSTKEEIEKLSKLSQEFDLNIFISFNPLQFPGQIEVFNTIKLPAIVVIAGNSCELEYFSKAELFLESNCYKDPSIKAIGKTINKLVSL